MPSEGVAKAKPLDAATKWPLILPLAALCVLVAAFLAPAGPPLAIHAAPASTRVAWQSFGLLLISLVGVVGLAKVLSPAIERAVVAADAPVAIVGIVIAMIVLLPETGAALRAAHANRLQTSLNLAIGSAMACIGLTVPVVVGAAVTYDLPLILGLGSAEIALLALTFVVGAITLVSGRTNMMQGAIHLIIFAAFLFLTLVP